MELLIYIVAGAAYLILTGFFGQYISTEKGRRGFEGFMLGVAFGPLGLLIAVWMPTLERVPVASPPPPRNAGDREPRLSDAEWSRRLSATADKIDVSGIVRTGPR